MKYIKKFNESKEVNEIVFSGKTKNGFEYNIVTVNDSRDELQITTEDGELLDASEKLHELVDLYINGDISTKSFLIDVEDITEAYDKMFELMDRGYLSLGGLVDIEDIED